MTTTAQLAAQKRANTDKRRYVKLDHKGGGFCIATPTEADAMRADDPDLIGHDVWMTQAEFEALPDFQGW
jgi:hypothetical protein